MAFWECVFTECRRWLELIAHEFTPAGGVDVWGVVVHPLVELVLPTVKVDEQQPAHAAPHRGHAHEAGLHQIRRLQLHVGAKAVTWVVLTCASHVYIRKRTAGWGVGGGV